MPEPFRVRVRNQILRWPRCPRVLWWLIKPVITAVAIAAAVLQLSSGYGVFAAVVAIIATLLLRPVAHPWIGLIIAVGIGLLVPFAGIAVGVRTVVSAVAVRCAGETWSEGLAVVECARRDYLRADVKQLDQEWKELNASIRLGADHFDVVTDSWTVFVAAWCTADFFVMVATARALLAGAITGNWPVRTVPGADTHVTRMLAKVGLIRVGYIWLAVGVAVVAVQLLGLPVRGRFFGLLIPAWGTFLLAGVCAFRIGRSEDKPLTWVGVVGATVLGILVYGWVGPIAQMIGATAGGAARVLRIRARQVYYGQQVPPPKLPAVPASLATRRQWAAACEAQRASEYDLAQRIWQNLAHAPGTNQHVGAAALAALVGVALAKGEIQQAVDRANRALGTLPLGSKASPMVHAAAGRAMLSAGDSDQALDYLTEAVRSRRMRRDPTVIAAHAQALGLSSEAAAARVVAKQAPSALRLSSVIEKEVAAALRLSDFSLQVRIARLEDFLSSDELELNVVHDPNIKQQIAHAKGRGWLVLGRLQRQRGRYSSAAESLRKAVSALTGPEVGVERAVAEALLGAALSRSVPGEAMAHLRPGVKELEHHRGQLMSDKHRGQLVERYGDVYTEVFEGTARLGARHGANHLAADLGESLRRGALARMLRAPTLQTEPELQKLRDRIAALESTDSVPQHPELRQCRETLAAQLSTLLAAAYLPTAVTYSAMRTRADKAHIVTYHVATDTPDLFAGHVIWAAPEKSPVVSRFRIDDPAILELLGSRGPEVRNRVMQARQSPTELNRWKQAATALFPLVLRQQLGRRSVNDPVPMVVVPVGRLAALPWVALRLDEGQLLVTVAVIQLVPTLELLHETDTQNETSRPDAPTLFHMALDNADTTGEDALRAGDRVVVAATRDSFVDFLATEEPAGAYLATHGNDEGLAQYVRFADGSRLSAATALTLRWPSWVVFASCLVGRVAIQPGHEPLGMPISCLLGGAQTVFGGVIEVFSNSTGQLTSRLVRRLDACEHPAEALRREQLALLVGRRTPARPFVWAGFVCLSRRQPTACTVRSIRG